MKRYAHDTRLGYVGDSKGEGAYAAVVSAASGKALQVGKTTVSLGNGYYYAVNPGDGAPDSKVVAELKALTKPASVAKDSK